ncbi:MAG: hypothetical protein VZQ84_00225 [Anaerovoracaceae bacterium]|nr:hypothetical protein [Anaerovoracaceae bacterium]
MKKALKSLLVAMLAVTVMLAFTACGEEEAAEKAVNSTMEALQEATLDEDSDAAKTLKKEIGSLNMPGLDEDAFVKALFGNMKYEITDTEKKDSDTVEVTMKVTNVDMKNAANKWVAQAKKDVTNTNSELYKAAVSGSTTKMYQVLFDSLFDQIDKNKSKTVTEEITVEVKKNDDGDWQMEPTSSDINKMCGNIMDAMASVQW